MERAKKIDRSPTGRNKIAQSDETLDEDENVQSADDIEHGWSSKGESDDEGGVADSDKE